MSPPLRNVGIRGVVHRLNTCFKASARSSRRRRRVFVWIVRTQMKPEMKFGSATLRQTVPFFHIMCIAHMTFSDKYIIIKSCFLIFLCHQCSTIVDKKLVLFVWPALCFLHENAKTNAAQLRSIVTSI